MKIGLIKCIVRLSKKLIWPLLGCSLLLLSACKHSADHAGALLPASAHNKNIPEQIVYRFDDHRYLVLQGFHCEGALWYIDKKQDIVTDLDTSYFRIFFFKYIHPSTRYIAVPFDDLSGIMISKDGGRTFISNASAHFSPGGGAIQNRNGPSAREIESFTVVGDRGYFMTKKGDLYLSSAPFGERWGRDYISLNALINRWQILADWDNFKNPPLKVPEVKNYTGWDRMRCNWDQPPAG